MGESFFKKSKWNFATYCGGDAADWNALSDACRRRDGYKCTQCGALGRQAGGNTTLNACHIVPKSKGGADQLYNLVTKCVSCHSQEKGHGHMKKSGW